MIKVIFNNGLDAICNHVITENRFVRSKANPRLEIEKCFVMLHFTKNATQEYEAKEIARLESVTLEDMPC